MQNMFVRALSRVLIVCLSAVSFQAQAGMIGTGEAAAAAQSQSARFAIELQLQALGVAPKEATARVAALTDKEVVDLTARLDRLPAGGIAGVLPLIVAAFLIYYLIIVPSGKETKEPAKK